MKSRQTFGTRGFRQSLAVLVIAGGALAPIALTPSEAAAAPLPPPGNCALPTDETLAQVESTLTPVAASVGDDLTPDWAAVNQVYCLATATACCAGIFGPYRSSAPLIASAY